ncbi:MAG TPA: hydroxymethylbilane synthase [Polyangiaceae bacterium]|jgi:hydroxymethylbilane synthase|nr:hydroxymethylbilane synthase [Polyangiaceae bacterium]
MTVLTVATRKSQLALAQCRAWMRDFTQATGVDTAELHVVTTGDRVQDVALSQIGGKGLFIKEIEEALIECRADVAVHSMKDVPAELAPTLVIGSVPLREDPRDVVVTRDGCRFEELRAGATVGTSSLRRMSMLRAWRPDLEYVPIRGNVDTRLRKCAEGLVDAVVLARAGLIRLGLEARATEILDPSRCLPAIGQGALAIERRAADDETHLLLDRLTHRDTLIAVTAERGVMTAVEGSCQMPVAAYGVREGDQLWLRGMLAEPDGSRAVFRDVRVAWPEGAATATALGIELGRALKGA